MADEQRTVELEERLAQLEARLERADRAANGRPGFESAFWALMHTLFPDEARKHMKAAGREQLLAARAYLDHWIAKMDDPAEVAPPRRETIEVK